MKEEKKHEYTAKKIEEVKAIGFTVYAPEELTSYFYIVSSDNSRFCYAQISFTGLELCYEYVPSANNGSGAKYEFDNNKTLMENINTVISGYLPPFVTGKVERWKDFDQFKSKRRRELVLY